jgi:hypothetical protein
MIEVLTHLFKRLGLSLPLVFLLAVMSGANPMNFSWRDQFTVHASHASGPIEAGDAAKFAALQKFDTLALLRMACRGER